MSLRIPSGARLSCFPPSSPLRHVALIFAGSILTLLAVPAARAADLWNNAADGNWDTNSNWFDGSKPTSADDVLLDNSKVTLPTSLYLSASGGSTSFTIKTLTLNTSASNVLASSSTNLPRTLTLNGNGLGTADLIAVSGSSTLTLQSNGTTGTLSLALGDSGKFNIGTGSTLDIQSVISGTSKSIEKTGAGILILRGTTNSFTGGVTLTAGTLTLGANAAQGTGNFTVNGGTVDVTANRTTSNNNTQTWNGDWTFGGTGTWNTGTGAVTLAASAIQLSNSGGSLLTVGGSATGTSNLTLKANVAGGITFTNINNTGTITNSGTGAGATTLTTVGSNVSALTLSSTTSALTATTLNVASGGTTLTNSLGTVKLTITNSVTGTGNLIIKNDSTLNSGITFTAGANNVGTITNSGSGAGTTTIPTVGANVTGIIQGASNSAATLTVTNQITGGGDFTLSNNGTSTAALTLTGGFNNTGTLTNNGTGGGLVTIGVIGTNVTNVTQNSASSQLTLSGANTYNNANGYNVTLGTLSISNATTFSNATKFVLSSGGRLDIAVANQSLAALAAPTGSGVVAGSFLRYSTAQATGGTGPGTIFGTVELNLTNVNPNYTLDFGTGSTFTNLVTSTYTSPITLSGNASIDSSTAVGTYSTGGITTSSTGSKTLTLTGSNTGTNLISSAITDGTGGNGALAVTKTGTGYWRLTGTNTLTGAVKILNGTLASAVSGATDPFGTGPIALGDTTGTNSATLYADVASTPAITYNSTLTVANGTTGNTLAIVSNNATMTFTSTVALNNNLTFANSNTGKPITLSGKVTEISNGTGYSITNGATVAGTLATAAGSSPVVLSGGVEIGTGGLTLNNNAPTSVTVGTGNITSTTTGNLIFNANGTGGFTVSAASINNAGTITNSGTGAGTTTVSGVIGTSVTGVTQNSAASTLALTGANTFSSGLTLTSGTLNIGVASASSGTGSLLNGAVGTGTLTINGGTISSGAINGAGVTNTLVKGDFTISSTGRLTWAGAWDLQGAQRNVSLTQNQTFANAISGTTVGFRYQASVLANSGLINQISNGTLRFAGSGVTTVTGVGLQDAVNFSSNAGLIIGSNVIAGATASGGGFGTGTNAPAVTVESGGYLNLSSASLETYSLAGAGTVTNLDTGSNTKTLTINNGNSQNFSGVITDGVSLNATTAIAALGKVALTKSGAGAQILSGVNAYTGGTAVNAGVLTYLNTNAKPATGTTIVAANATLGLGVAISGSFFTSADVDSLFSGTLSGVTNNAASNVGIDTTAGDFTYATNVSSSRGLTKLGSNKLTLSGDNSYSGPTNVSGGTLEISGSISGTAGTGIQVNNSGTLLLSGTSGLQVNDSAAVNLNGGKLGFSNAANQIETVGVLTLSANSTLDFGVNGGNDTFLFAALPTRTGGLLTIDNWVGNQVGGVDGINDRLVFLGDVAAPGSFANVFGQADVSFTGFGSGYGAIAFGTTSYEIVAVPEPASTGLLGAAAVLGLVAFRERGRLLRRKR